MTLFPHESKQICLEKLNIKFKVEKYKFHIKNFFSVMLFLSQTAENSDSLFESKIRRRFTFALRRNLEQSGEADYGGEIATDEM